MVCAHKGANLTLYECFSKKCISNTFVLCECAGPLMNMMHGDFAVTAESSLLENNVQLNEIKYAILNTSLIYLGMRRSLIIGSYLTNYIALFHFEAWRISVLDFLKILRKKRNVNVRN